MSNPVGLSPLSGAPQGLAPCGVVRGFLPNFVGDGSDPEQAGGNGLFFYLRPLAPEPLIDDGPACSPTPLEAVGSSGALYPYNQFPLNSNQSVSVTSGLAETAALATSCRYVIIEISGTVFLGGGFQSCTTTPEPAVLGSFTVSMGGPLTLSDELTRATLVGAAPPTIGAPFIYTLLRPTALTWTGQDPDNLWNRAIWRRTEVGAITWAVSALCHDYDISFNYLLTGYKLDTYPQPCPFRPSVIPTTVIPGPSQSGVIDPPYPVTGVQGGARTRSHFGIRDLVLLARSKGFGANSPMAAAIAMAESGGDPHAIFIDAGPPESEDRGLWQINSFFHPEVSDQCAFTPGCCASAAFTISSGGTDWSPWATFHNGSYLQFLPQALAIP